MTAGELEEREDRLSGIVAVIIALATLVGAVVGFLQADTSNASNDRRLQAEQLSLQALAGSQREQAAAQLRYEAYIRSVEQQTAAAHAFLRSLYTGDDTPEERALLREQERLLELAEASRRLTDIGPDHEHGPEQDPAFPARYFANATYESLRLNALQDAANEEAGRLDERAASYTAILAMLAVSLYLFGLTLAERGRLIRRGFLGVGLGLFGVAGLWTLLVATAPVTPASNEAADAYARARVALDTSYDRAGFLQAEADYGRAVELRPTFARAWAERSDATFLANTPQRGGFASIVPPEALARARADLERAMALGLENAPTLGSLGFYTFLEGTQTADQALLEESVAFTRRAIEIDPGEPVYHYNLGVALTAMGSLADAEAAYAEAVARTLYIDESRSELRAEPAVEEAWVAGALTDLAIVERHRPDLGAAIARLRERIVGPVSRGTLDPPPATEVTFGELEVDVLPAELQWQGALDGYDAERDTLSTQWYHRATDDGYWAALPGVSGTTTPGQDEDGQLFHLTSYIATVVPPECVPPGQYRVEVYANGMLAGSAEADASFEPSDAVIARDVTIAFCRPPAWTPLEETLPGLLAGYQSDDGQHGAYAIRYGFPRRFGEIPGVTTLIMDVTLESFAEFFPGPPVLVEESGTDETYFLGLEQPAWRWYEYDGGLVRAGAGLSADGVVMVGLVFGPDEWFDTDEPYRILSSMVLFE